MDPRITDAIRDTKRNIDILKLEFEQLREDMKYIKKALTEIKNKKK